MSLGLFPRDEETSDQLVGCPHAHACAGCPLIERPYEQQLEWKRERVLAALAYYPELAGTDVHATSPSLPTGYRVRAKLMVAPAVNASAAVRVGLYARPASTLSGASEQARSAEAGEHVVVDTPACRVLTPALASAANAMRDLLRTPPRTAGSVLEAAGAGGCLSAVDLREVLHDGARSVLVTLVLEGGGEPADDALYAAASSVQSAVPLASGVAVNYRRPGSPQVLGGVTRVLAGVSEAPDSSGGAYHLATYGAFTQANRGQAQHIAATIAGHLERALPLMGQRVLDLYGGSGALSLPLAARGARVTLVETFAAAAQAAARAAERQRLPIDVRQGDAGRVARDLAKAGARFDALVVNPPRRGLAPEVRRAAVALRPQTIAYVSCDPDTLARDLSHFARLGYTARALAPVDMMPLTDQVETVAFLERAAPWLPVTVYRDDEVHVTEWLGSEKPAPPADGDLLAATAGDAGSGLAVWARTSSACVAWRAALATARKSYLVLVRGTVAPKGSVRAGSRWRRTAVVHGHSLLRVTAAHHAIDRDLARLGHPIIGDERFGHAATNRHFEEKYGLDRAFIHVSRVELSHPGHAGHAGHPRPSRPLTLTPRVPGDLLAVLARLGHAYTSNSSGE